MTDDRAGLHYPEMNEAAASIPVGCDGLCVLPFGNGAERTLHNRDIGTCIHGLNVNVHTLAHVFRAAQEGVVFALKHGIDAMASTGAQVKRVRASHANLFLSPFFCGAFATVAGATVELYNTDGAQAPRGAVPGRGSYM